jgi:hypothetical protein
LYVLDEQEDPRSRIEGNSDARIVAIKWEDP